MGVHKYIVLLNSYMDFVLDQTPYHGNGAAIALSSGAINDTFLSSPKCSLQKLTNWVIMK